MVFIVKVIAIRALCNRIQLKNGIYVTYFSLLKVFIAANGNLGSDYVCKCYKWMVFEIMWPIIAVKTP